MLRNNSLTTYLAIAIIILSPRPSFAKEITKEKTEKTKLSTPSQIQIEAKKRRKKKKSLIPGIKEEIEIDEETINNPEEVLFKDDNENLIDLYYEIKSENPDKNKQYSKIDKKTFKKKMKQMYRNTDNKFYKQIIRISEKHNMQIIPVFLLAKENIMPLKEVVSKQQAIAKVDLEEKKKREKAKKEERKRKNPSKIW